MRILFLNQFFPPDPAPTGLLLHELGENLKAQGHTVEYIGAGQDYRKTKKQGSRTLREAKALASLLWLGLRARRPDIVFSASSPPCLLFVATLVAFRHRALSVHWIMDLYPDVAVALKEIREGLLFKLISGLMTWCYRQTAAVIALDEEMAGRLANLGIRTNVIIPPWILFGTESPDSQSLPDPSVPFTTIYSGNLGRAHEWETLLEAQRILESRGAAHRLLFQGGGPAWETARQWAETIGLRNVDWRGYVAPDRLVASLLRCDLLVATQRPETQGMLWPSKLALLLSLPRPILWIGPVKGSIARRIALSPEAGLFAPGAGAAIADWLEWRSKMPRNPVPPLDPDPARSREVAIEKLVNLLEGLAGGRPGSAGRKRL